jgi:hypothetical protein
VTGTGAATQVVHAPPVTVTAYAPVTAPSFRAIGETGTLHTRRQAVIGRIVG